MTSRNPWGAQALTLTLVALLASCSVLGTKPAAPLRSYTLGTEAPAAVPTAARVAAGPVLLVEVPRAAPGYDSTRMVYTRQAQTQEAYANTVWSDTRARLLAPLLVARLQQSGPFGAVLLAPSAAKAGLRLDSTILRLQQDFLQVPSQLRFTLQLTLMDNATRQVMAWRTVDIVQPAPTDDAAGGAVAAQLAVQQALQQVSDFLQSAVVAVPAKD